MASHQYDTFKKIDAELIWIESAGDLDAAEERIEELSKQSDAQHIVYDQRSKRIIASFG